MMKQLLCALTLLLALFGTAEAKNSPSAKSKLKKGKLIEGKYLSPDGSFLIEPPVITAGLKIYPSSNKTICEIFFGDDFGSYFQIFIDQNLGNHLVESLDSSQNNRLFLEKMFQQAFWAQMEKHYKTIERVESTFIAITPEKEGYFVISRIPHGSLLTKTSEKEHLDTTRGYLIYRDGKRLVLLAYANDLPRPEELPKKTAEEVKEELMTRLVEAAKSLKFLKS